jgi:hypothetical protein
LQTTLKEENRDVDAIIAPGIKKLREYYKQVFNTPAYLLGVGE